MNLAEFEKKIKNECKYKLNWKTLDVNPNCKTAYDYLMYLSFIDKQGFKYTVSKVITTSRISDLDYNNIYAQLRSKPALWKNTPSLKRGVNNGYVCKTIKVGHL